MEKEVVMQVKKKKPKAWGSFLGGRWNSLVRGLRSEKTWGVGIWQIVGGASGDLAITETWSQS